MDNDYALYFEFYTNAVELSGEDAIAFFNKFFAKRENMDAYIHQYRLKTNEVDALERLFDKDDLYTRITDALDYDPYCYEAFLMLTKYQNEDEDRLYDLLSRKYEEICKETHFTEHGRDNAVLIANMYADFLNYTQETRTSLIVQDKIVELNGEFDPVLLLRYIYSYSATNDTKALYELFTKYNQYFTYIEFHLTLLEVFLRNNDDIDAIEVLEDLCEKIPDFIDNSDGDIRIASKYLSDVQMVPELEEWILRNKVRGRH